MPNANQKVFTDAVAKGIVEGTLPLLKELSSHADKRHDLRNAMDTCANKVHELDSEVRGLKGVIFSLVGQGDGSTGLVPRVESEMKELKEDVATLKSDVGSIMEDIKAIRASQSKQDDLQTKSNSFMDNWKGVGIAIGIMGTCVTIASGVVAALFWLFSHGGIK